MFVCVEDHLVYLGNGHNIKLKMWFVGPGT